MTSSEVEAFLKQHAGVTFKNVTERTDTEEITILTNRHGQTTTLKKNASGKTSGNEMADNQGQHLFTASSKKTKKYIMEEGTPVPFLVKLGVMTKEGKVVSQKYDKFRQINRFLEYIADILDDVQRLCTGTRGFTKERPLHIADFGCGKSYLTFAVYYFLNDIKHVPVDITGLDLKTDVIADCQSLAEELGCSGLHFYVGDIAQFNHQTAPDIIITLHACDTATDYALHYAVEKGAAAILSVPCCQHEINLSLDAEKELFSADSPFSSLMRYGIIKERFSALVTDAVRADVLEQNGYSVQILEFIDISHTPKNLLIRAIKRQTVYKKAAENAQRRTAAILSSLNVGQTLSTLLSEKL
ncbi:MAG: SAM-dependent methyltransferase [Treponema sp.]|nr:SAM-dependent methyltransferase [Treponema sp.]